MEQNNLNTKLRNLFTKYFLYRFIDFSKYENNPELALRHHKLSYKLVALYGLIFIIPFSLEHSESMNQNITFGALLTVVFVGFILASFSLDAFNNKLLDMGLLENRDERAKLMDKYSYTNAIGGIFVFFLVWVPLLVLFILVIHYFIK